MEARIAERTDIAVIRVLIADDHAIVRDGLRALIYAQSRLVVVGEAANGAEAVDRTRMLRPHVVVIDVSMPNVNGIEATARITKECPGVKVLALSMHEERGYVARVFRAGADGYALKRSASSELVRAIRAVVGGERYLDPSL
ncbi:MAG TPA: response regulator transcription factor, partial [Gemmatimonadaceae bacterium]|nr:response regulator transcription factor [Gemmatimonadaceae bacterium]